MIDEDILPLEENMKFDVTKHKKEVFGMFMGQEEKVTFDVHKSLLDVIYDMKKAKITGLTLSLKKSIVRNMMTLVCGYRCTP